MNCMEHVLRPDLNRDWLSLILIGSFVIMALIHYNFPKRISELFLLLFNDKYFALNGYKKGIGHPFHIVMIFLQILAFGLFLTVINIDPNLIDDKIEAMALIRMSILVTIYMFMRYGFDWLIGEIFNCQSLLKQYRYERLSYHHLMAILFIILFAALFFVLPSVNQFAPIFKILFLLGLILTLIYSVRRNSITLFRNFLYFILYICALEIAPYALLYQVARG